MLGFMLQSFPPPRVLFSNMTLRGANCRFHLTEENMNETWVHSIPDSLQLQETLPCLTLPLLLDHEAFT